jgi:hypothetical protein
MQNALAKASFTDVTDKARPIPVHFNPVSLQYGISNTLAKKGNGNQTKQVVSQSTATLALELSFDSTDSGRDVREATGPIAHFMQPARDNTPPVVLFSWGSFQFQGMLTSYRETLDFFSPEGVPLRASVSIGMAAQDRVFDDAGDSPAGSGAGAVLAVGGNLTRLAGQIGDPRAARGIALANGAASLRLGASVELEVGTRVAIAPAAGFATGASAGFGVGAGAGLGVGAGASANGAASLAPFGELHTPRPAQFSLDPQALLPAPESVGLATDAGAGFSISGAATPGVASFSARLGR